MVHKGVENGHPLNRQAIMQIFTQKHAYAGLPCSHPDHSVPDLETVTQRESAGGTNDRPVGGAMM